MRPVCIIYSQDSPFTLPNVPFVVLISQNIEIYITIEVTILLLQVKEANFIVMYYVVPLLMYLYIDVT